MATTAEFAPTNETTRRAQFLPYFLITMVVLGALSALTMPAFFVPEREPGHQSPRACIDRGGEMQAVSTGHFGSGSRAVCLFPDGTTFKIIPHVEFVEIRSKTERGRDDVMQRQRQSPHGG